MKKLFFLCAFSAIVLTAFATQGALSGKFTINADGDQVVFSQGNLQYVGTWQFATNQWDTIGAAQADNHRDLFGWGTGNNPNNVSTAASNYATYTEWGNNPITNGGNAANLWRTLSQEEGKYLLMGRTNAATLFAFGSVNGVNGLILLPDNWTLPAGASFTASTTQGVSIENSSYYDFDQNDHFTDNTYTTEQWRTMEDNGAVFLPAAGYREGTVVKKPGLIGQYWSSTPSTSESNAFFFPFSSYLINTTNSYYRYHGRSVRLVQEFITPEPELKVAYVCDFRKRANGHNSYGDVWTYDGSWTIAGGSNNSGSWDYCKFGGNQTALEAINPVYLKSVNLFERDIKQIKIYIHEGSLSTSGMGIAIWGASALNTNGEGRTVYFNNDEITSAAQTYTWNVPSEWAEGFSKGRYFEVFWSLANTTAVDGIICIDKVEFLSDEESPTPPTSIESVQQSTVSSQKLLRNGQLLIRRGDEVFNAQGVRVE